MTVGRSVNIALLPHDTAKFPADLYVVIDALRATTMIVTLLERGARAVTVVNAEDAARKLAARGGALLAGEVGGVAPPGFDLGNSPVEAGPAGVDGRDVMLFTTNGTRALCMAAQIGPTLAGALTNAGAVVERCRQAERVTFVCAGNSAGTTFSIEDFAVAAAMALPLADADPGRRQNDGVVLARAALTGTDGGASALMRSGRHAATLRNLGLDADIEFACQRDVTRVVPEVTVCGEGWARLETRG